MLTFRLMRRGYGRLASRRNEIVVQQKPSLLKVAIIGMPNAGKSTLINQIMESEVCPVSKRVHTTRQRQQAVYLQNNTQVIFVDTPGVVNKKEAKKFQFPEDFVTGPHVAIESADVVGVVHDVSNRILRHKLDPRVVHILNEYPTKNCVLILNKVDLVKRKRSLLEAVRFLTKATVSGQPIAVTFPKSQKPLLKNEIFQRARARELNLSKGIANHCPIPQNSDDLSSSEVDSDTSDVNGWAGFNDIFMISALTGNGIELLKDYFVCNAKPSPWEFGEEVLTDCPPMELAIKVLKSKLLEHLPQEIPYQIVPSIDFWEETDSDTLRIVFGIKCPSARFAKIVIGQGGNCISQITVAVEKALSNLIQKIVDLHIKVTIDEKPK